MTRISANESDGRKSKVISKRAQSIREDKTVYNNEPSNIHPGDDYNTGPRDVESVKNG